MSRATSSSFASSRTEYALAEVRPDTSVRRARQSSPARDFSVLKIDFGANVAPRIIIAIDVALEERGSIAGDLAVGPETRLFQPLPVVNPIGNVTAFRLVLQNLARRTPSQVDRIGSHSHLDLPFVDELLLLVWQSVVRGGSFLLTRLDRRRGTTDQNQPAQQHQPSKFHNVETLFRIRPSKLDNPFEVKWRCL
jgi:hypothetical protein